jgi:predicted solute-binding protein
MCTNEEFTFAGAPYSNSAPLVDRLQAVDPRVRVIHDHPANLVADLREGRADVALIPVVHLFRHPKLRMIDGLGVAADGAVRSVLLKCRVPVQQVKTVRRDAASATSNVLAKILLKDHFGCSVAWTESADATVVIGDRALCSEPAVEDVDLAEAWKAMTGLPFVFAVWAVRRDFKALDTVTEIARRAYASADLEQISADYVAEHGRTKTFWFEYLSESIHYLLTEQDRAGMEQFRRLCEGEV